MRVVNPKAIKAKDDNKDTQGERKPDDKRRTRARKGGGAKTIDGDNRSGGSGETEGMGKLRSRKN